MITNWTIVVQLISSPPDAHILDHKKKRKHPVLTNKSMDLLGSDTDDEGNAFKINRTYAKNYDTWRKKEEKQKLLDRYGDADLSTSSSDEEEIRSTAQMDKDWLRTYAVVRFQQPRLYKEGEKFFHDEAKPVSKKKEKATTLKDHERKFLLEKGGIESDEDSKPKHPESKSYFEEQEEIKQSLKEVIGDSDDEEGGLLIKKEKTSEEKNKEENDFLDWLKGRKDELDDKEAAAELAPLKAYWNDPNLSEKELVLRDYILNNGYIDQEDSDESEDEVQRELPNFDAEEQFLEKAEEYEHKYNFRHEEPEGDELKSYPRVIETSVRTKDTRRAEQRQRKLEKKKMIKEQRQEEIRLLQKIQLEERKEKLEKLRKIADKPDLEYDLDADFDPEEHNKVMQKYFNEDYYGDDEVELKKPKFEYDAGIDDEPEDDWWQERLKEKDGAQDVEEEYYEPGPDDPDFIMDADYDPTQDYKREKNKNKKKKKGLVEKLPEFDPAEKTFEEYIEECLRGRINSIPFPYREVVPNDYGLSTEEILKAPERELNSWVSVKKMSQYKSKQEELADRRKFKARAHNADKKVKILPSLLVKEKKGKKKKKSQSSPESEKNEQSEALTCSLPEEKKMKKKKKKLELQSNPECERNEQSEALTCSLPEEKKMKKKKRKLQTETNSDSELGEKKKTKLATKICGDSIAKKKKKIKLETETNGDSETGPKKRIKLKTEPNGDQVIGPKKTIKLEAKMNKNPETKKKKTVQLKTETNGDSEIGLKKTIQLETESNGDQVIGPKKPIKLETKMKEKKKKLQTETNNDSELGEKKKIKLATKICGDSITKKKKTIKLETVTNGDSEIGPKKMIKLKTEPNGDQVIGPKKTIKLETKINKNPETKKKKTEQLETETNSDPEIGPKKTIKFETKMKGKKRKLQTETNNDSELGEKKKIKLETKICGDSITKKKKTIKLETETNGDSEIGPKKTIKLETKMNENPETKKKETVQLKTETNGDPVIGLKKMIKLETEINKDTETIIKKKFTAEMTDNSKTGKRKNLIVETYPLIEENKILQTKANNECETCEKKKVSQSEILDGSEIGDKREIKLDRETNANYAFVPMKKSELTSNSRRKKKKKKISIKNFSAADKNEKKVLDSRQLERQLSKVMSAARLSKYGIGPNVFKMKNKHKKHTKQRLRTVFKKKN
ncbi:KRRI-Interacting protein 1 [Bulinus truncatus]|nr:KRRI-Interacting protein 1 [Bulinus truncatus]